MALSSTHPGLGAGPSFDPTFFYTEQFGFPGTPVVSRTLVNGLWTVDKDAANFNEQVVVLGQETAWKIYDLDTLSFCVLALPLECRFGYGDNFDNFIGFERVAGGLSAINFVSGTSAYLGTAVTYDAAAMKYMRLRLTSGTIYWEYGANRSSWTVLHSQSSTGLPTVDCGIQAKMFLPPSTAFVFSMGYINADEPSGGGGAARSLIHNAPGLTSLTRNRLVGGR